MYRVNMQDTTNRKIIEKLGPYIVYEYDHDLSTSSANAMQEYYAAKMNVRKRQVLCQLNGQNDIIVQASIALHQLEQ